MCRRQRGNFCSTWGLYGNLPPCKGNHGCTYLLFHTNYRTSGRSSYRFLDSDSILQRCSFINDIYIRWWRYSVVGTYRRLCVRHNTILHHTRTLCEKAKETKIWVVEIVHRSPDKSRLCRNSKNVQFVILNLFQNLMFTTT